MDPLEARRPSIITEKMFHKKDFVKFCALIKGQEISE